MKSLLSGLRLQKDNPKFLLAQYDALSAQIPILYVLLVINALSVAITHIHAAPLWLALDIPVALSVVCVFRIIWWQMNGKGRLDAERAYKVMRRTIYVSGVLTVGFGGWAIALYQYGNPFQQGQIAYFLVVTGISCIFCLMHLPAAAFVTTAITFSMMVVVFMFSGNPVFQATALSVMFLAYPFIRVINSYFQNFSGLVRLTEELEEKQKEAERLNLVNSRNALHDQLTGLANRRSFFRELQILLEAHPDQAPIVGLVDLDGFKPVNDVFGHAAGDQVLKETAARFQALIGSHGTVARLGGDEFGVIFPRDMSRDDVSDRGHALCAALRQAYEVPGGSIRVSGSCGIVYPEGGGHTVEELYEKADLALYQVKNKRNGGVEFFSDDLETILKQRHLIELELQGDDFARELKLEYQPIVDLADGRVVGLEALARWDSARFGRISPDAFIPAAERTAVIGKMTRTLFAQALQALAVIPAPVRLSFNLSARDICDQETSMALLAMINAATVDPRRIEFEITETALLSDFDTAYEVIGMLRSAGITIALDDFGTGFSSLSHIHRLEFDKIKIDKSFVMQFEQDMRCMNITRSVADLCHNLGIASVAEGVETAEIAKALYASGVRLAQGYHFSRPLSLDRAIEFVRQNEAGTMLPKAVNA
ncbi:EAL domain-containing protein [Neorhizobium sp. P12A]|jgi:diguanylate cyclase (GGDEF)-like protein|uniref:putative bifunctional diguanylate cyclase/phosphodiesterase n=1 Tax=Rhizobium/Agrobacterium group TaxID=227290 RepID=UPI001044F16C|nr:MULTISPECIES: EAL domain-containing protein [Rhizobium/Agrobacterium group]KAA0699466.1 EAL domain-containing protein [Neorhizobium sp. P12A]TCR91061.1 diguanylate cyclase/phosphodiesterase [Rhizobium sp. BK376]